MRRCGFSFPNCPSLALNRIENKVERRSPLVLAIIYPQHPSRVFSTVHHEDIFTTASSQVHGGRRGQDIRDISTSSPSPYPQDTPS